MRLQTLGASATAALLASAAMVLAGSGQITMVPAFMVSGLAPSATSDTTNAGNITSGTLASGRLPLAAASAPGAVALGTPAAGSFVTGFNGSGVAQYGPASFGGLTGTLAGAQIPAPTITPIPCDGSTTAFTLASTPTAASKVSLNLGGVMQMSTAFTISGATLTTNFVCQSGASGEAKVYP